MKNLLLIGLLALGACSLLEKKEDAVVTPPSNKPVRNCVQQVEPKNPAIPCKTNDWYAEGDAKCSSTKEKCLAK